MNVMKNVVGIMVVFLICFGSVLVCSANDKEDVPNKGTFLYVVDKSKESYGAQLRSDVYAQLEKQLKIEIVKESELQGLLASIDLENISKAEQPELLEIVTKAGVNRLIVVEILPTKSEFTQVLFYQAIKSEATLKVRFYDAVKRQYLLNEEEVSTNINKTMIPYTFVGKKSTVLKAVHKAAMISAERINQSLE